MFCKEKEFQDSPVGKIPSDWNVVKLEELIHFRNGERPQISDGGSVPIYGANGIMGYTKEALTNNDFTLIVGRVGASGQIHLGEGKIWVSDNAIYSERYDKTKVNLQFLFYLLRHKKLEQFASKTTHPIITQTFLNNFLVQLPPLNEQKVIVEVLSVVDSAIELVDKIIWKTERLKKALMQTLLTRGIGHKEFKETEIGKIPKTWQTVKLGEIGNFQYGITASAIKEDTGIKLLRITDITDEGINWKEVPYCKISEAEFDKYKLNLGDVLFARIGATTGKSCYINQPVKAVFGSYLIKFIPIVKEVDTRFL
ncbi:MAG: restriction endonuclease subunit S, partial [Nitrososphaeria archaeon]